MSWRSASTSDGGNWLVQGEHVLASLEVADGHAGRARGLLGRDGTEGALALVGVRSVHTIGMRFAIDVAFCDDAGTVLRIVTMRPGRLSRVVWRAAVALEAEAGSFDRWGVHPGDVLEYR